MSNLARCLEALIAGFLGLASISGVLAQGPFEHFITRRGDKLMDGENEFRFVGMNVPGVTMPYDYTLDIPSRMVLPTPWELEDSFKTLQQMNARCVRWNMLPVRLPRASQAQPYELVLAPGRFNETAFQTIDHALALANRYGIRVVFSFTGAGGDTAAFAGAGVYAAHRGKSEEDFYTDPQLKEDFRETIRYVLGRTNTVTGLPYRDDRAILCWQTGNEMGHLCKQAPEAVVAWEGEMAAFIKQIDAQHLVMNGHALKPVPATVDANIDIYTQHYYGAPAQWAARCRSDCAKLKGKRPFVVAEYGPYIVTPQEAEPVMKGFRALLDATIESGTAGALLWSMYFHHRDGGFWWHQMVTQRSVWAYHWPGFESGKAHREQDILTDLRAAAFRIDGKSVPPVPVPDVPELLPVGETPLLSWRGSAGASGYDIQRAPNREGPWQTIATNVSDADVVYRPLFSDTTVRPGQICFYRVVARNASGSSPASNVVGPVEVKRLCFVDELQDLSRVHSKSAGLTLDNEYNGLFAEYLYRARGAEGEWIVYRLPGPLQSLRVSACLTDPAMDLGFAVSTDGGAFTPVSAERSVKRFRPVPLGPAAGQQRTFAEYHATTAPANNVYYLKIEWHGPADLDRVEIDYK